MRKRSHSCETVLVTRTLFETCATFADTVCHVCGSLPRRQDGQHGCVDVADHRAADRHPHVLP